MPVSDVVGGSVFAVRPSRNVAAIAMLLRIVPAVPDGRMACLRMRVSVLVGAVALSVLQAGSARGLRLHVCGTRRGSCARSCSSLFSLRDLRPHVRGKRAVRARHAVLRVRDDDMRLQADELHCDAGDDRPCRGRTRRHAGHEQHLCRTAAVLAPRRRARRERCHESVCARSPHCAGHGASARRNSEHWGKQHRPVVFLMNPLVARACQPLSVCASA